MTLFQFRKLSTCTNTILGALDHFNWLSMVRFSSLSSFFLWFNISVQGSEEANILFSSCLGCDGYRIILGANRNSQSYISQEKGEIDQEKYQERRISNCNSMQNQL